ncbi:XdhC family protein [Pontibacter sp. CAU 1760]
MKEIQDIVAAYEIAQREGLQTALATVVHVQGSSYRRPGARMLVTEAGHLTGAISGGCLEGDALRKARLVMVQRQPMLVTYDTTDEDDATLGVGLGCNGIIQILIEPIDAADPDNPLQLLKAFLERRQEAILVTLFSLADKKAAQVGTRFLLSESGSVHGVALSDKELQVALQADAEDALRKGESLVCTYVGETQTWSGFVEVLKPAVHLVIVGAGNDAFPMVQLAAVLGWKTTVVDGRANYASVTRFPEVSQVLVAKPVQVLEHLSLDRHTVFVLMTHNYNYDLAMLRQLIPLAVPYIGSLGPKKKLMRMLDELEDEGIAYTAAQLQHVYGPTGLDLGAETPEEIALSIISEIRAVLSQKSGSPLRGKMDPIHQRAQDEIRTRYLAGAPTVTD